MRAAPATGTLAIFLHTIYLLHHTLPTVWMHHVCFKEIGEMSGALLYIHMVVMINISGLAQSTHCFWHNVHQLQKGYNEKEQKAMKLEKHCQLKSDGSVFELWS